MRDCEIKYLSAARLIELLQLLPSDTRISANAVGNFLVWSADGCEDIGFIDTAHEGEFISFKPDQAAPAPRAAPAWRPIETAPFDGTLFLGWAPPPDGIPQVISSSIYWQSMAPNAPRHMPIKECKALTHWMPIPAAPQTEEPR